MNKIRWIPVNPYNVAAMEDWLNEMSIQGYQVVKIGKIYAKFSIEKNERNYYHCIPGEEQEKEDLTYVTSIDGKIQVYSSKTRIKSTYQNEGDWKRLEKTNYFNLFSGLAVVVMGVMLFNVKLQPSKSWIVNLIIGNWEEVVVLITPIITLIFTSMANQILLRKQNTHIPKEGTLEREEGNQRARRRWKMRLVIPVVSYTLFTLAVISCLMNINNDLGVALPTQSIDLPTIALNQMGKSSNEQFDVSGETINICYRRYSYLAQKQYYINQINGRMNLKSWYIETINESLASILSRTFATAYKNEDGYHLENIESEEFGNIYYVKTDSVQVVTMYQEKQAYLYVYEGKMNLKEHLQQFEDKIEIFNTTDTFEQYFVDMD